jgi:hypothetical protein
MAYDGHHDGWLQNDPTPRTNPLADKPKSKKRQKYVYKSDEIPHLFVHKTQDSARNQQGNFYFDGDTLYSYGSHYPLAQHVTGVNGEAGILVNVSTRNRGGSPTTTQQRNRVRHSIPDSITTFDVETIRVEQYGHDVNIASFQADAKTQLEKARNGRKYGASSLASAFEFRTIATKYAAFFGIETPDFSFLPAGLELEKLEAQIAERRARADVADAERNRKEQARRLERQRLAAFAVPEKIAAWRAGKPVNTWDLPTMLRIDGEEVVTSQGARVPVEHAKRVLGIVCKVKERGEPFVTNGHTIPIGVYRVDRIDADGTLHAGCHHITFDEIQAIAPQLEGKIEVTPRAFNVPTGPLFNQ